MDNLALDLLPVYIPGHAKVSNFSHSSRPSTGKEAVPSSNVPTKKGKKSEKRINHSIVLQSKKTKNSPYFPQVQRTPTTQKVSVHR